MANKVQLKRSAVPGKVPATTDLDLGEIAINTYDGKAYIKKNVSGTESIVPLGGAGSGDVTGPNTSTDNAIARFDGASGKIIQNSTGTIDDSGNASLASLSLTTDLAVTHGGTGASDAAGARTNLGLGSLATLSSINNSNWSGAALAIANGGTGETTRQAAMDALAGATTAGQYLRGNGTDVVMSAIQAADVPILNQNTTGTASNVTGTVAVANGGTGATTAANARTNLGLGSLATLSSINNGNWSGTDLSIANGGTGASTASAARANLGAQETLVSGTNIKTVNDGSLLGSGNLAVGTVTSVALSAPTGFSVSGSPVSSSGTLALSFAAGYSLPTDSSQANWDTAFADRFKWDGGSAGLNAATGRTSLGLGALATLSSVGASTITDNSVGAAELNVVGNGTTSQWLRSDGDGSFTWATPPNTTYSAGNGIGLSGTTFSVAAGGGLQQDAAGLSHADTSSQASVNNSGNTFIQDITLDTYGHITGIVSAAAPPNTTYSAGNGIGLSGTTFSVAAGGGLQQDAAGLSHADTSSQASVNNSGNTFIQDITLDTYGHITGIVSAAAPGTGLGVGQTWQAVTRAQSTNYTNSTGKAIALVVTYTATQVAQRCVFVVGGVTIRPQNGQGNISTFGGAMIVIPNGATYQWYTEGGTASSITTQELR